MNYISRTSPAPKKCRRKMQNQLKCNIIQHFKKFRNERFCHHHGFDVSNIETCFEQFWNFEQFLMFTFTLLFFLVTYFDIFCACDASTLPGQRAKDLGLHRRRESRPGRALRGLGGLDGQGWRCENLQSQKERSGLRTNIQQISNKISNHQPNSRI